MGVKYRWESNFHRTFAYSTLTQDDVENIDRAYYAGYINSKDAGYRKLKRIENKLCASKECRCGMVFVGRV